jgi:hypothetical protein
MAFNGSGTFVRLKNWTLNAAQNINILPDLMDADTNDIATGLSQCITRDGQGVPTADIPWNNFGITGLRAPALAGDAATKGYVDTGATAMAAYVNTATAARSMGGFVINLLGAPVVSTDAANKAYVDAQAYSMAVPATINAATTLFLNSNYGGF